MKLEWKTCLRIGVTLLIIAVCIMLLPKLGEFGAILLSAVSPLTIGCVIAYIVNILVSMYERIWFPHAKKKILIKSRRFVCITLSFLTLALVVVLVVSLVLPQFISCIMLLIEKIPAAIKQIVAELDEKHMITDEVVNMLNSIDWKTRFDQLIDVITSGIGDVLNIVIGTVTSVFSGIVTGLIAVIFSIYLLSGKEKLGRQYERLMRRYVKESVVEKLDHVFAVMHDCFTRYIIGQCTEAVILGALCTLGMLALRLPYAAMIGALMSFTALIPIAGAYIGAFVGAFMIVTVSPIKALVFLVFIVILQQLEGNIIYPRVVGSSLRLPGIWVLAAVTVGGGLFGIIGMLIGVPLAATAYRLIGEDVRQKEAEKKASEAQKQTEEALAEAAADIASDTAE